MRLHIAGGCGEHGRNCFCIEGEEGNILVDCGIMPFSQDGWPRLSAGQVKRARWLFLTHSHSDHAGAWQWLLQRGFTGRVAVSQETARQLQLAPDTPPLHPERYAAPGEALQLEQGLEIRWGRAGHCAGSLWYHIGFEGKTVFFSGDYVADSALYACDAPHGLAADLAVVDCACGRGIGDGAVPATAQMREGWLRGMQDLLADGKTLLLPVPKHGRGCEQALLLHRNLPGTALYADDAALLCGAAWTPGIGWAHSEAGRALRALQPDVRSLPDGSALLKQPAVWFVHDAQLRQPQSRRRAELVLRGGGCVLFTGHVYPHSPAEALLAEQPGAARLPFPVHGGQPQLQGLLRDNRFCRVLPFHGPGGTKPPAMML